MTSSSSEAAGRAQLSSVLRPWAGNDRVEEGDLIYVVAKTSQLDLLAELGLVRRVHSEQHCQRYARAGTDRHYLVCDAVDDRQGQCCDQEPDDQMMSAHGHTSAASLADESLFARPSFSR